MQSTTTMTSKERVLTTFAHEEADRVPIDYASNPALDGRLKEHFSLDPKDGEGLLRALNVDFRGVNAAYAGPKLHQDVGDRKVDIWGIHRRYVDHGTGGYWDYCDFPLREATEEEIAAWPMPDPDDYDYSKVAERCRALSGYAIGVGGAGYGDIINSNGMIRTMEQTLVDLVTDDPAGLLLVDRRHEIQLEVLRRTLEAARGAIDFLKTGEDLGTQIAPMISMDLFRKHIRPRHQKYIDLARSFDIPVMIHTCGSSSWAYEDFIEMGITVVDTLQPEATNMSPRYLKDNFGGRLAFHGCISTAGVLAHGSVEDIVGEVRETLEIMMPGGGYCLSPTHSMQDNTPTENAVAMYRAAVEYGTY
jgi:uroporphyrinogen decarboxylase